MSEIKLTKEDTYRGSLILVTPDFPIREIPKTAKLRSVPGGSDILLKEQASVALRALLANIGCGDEIAAVSGFRTQEEQEKIWEDSMAQNGEAFTRKFVAVPGCSEHQSGYAIDLARNAGEIDFICPEFPHSGIFGKFRERMAHYGFVERYAAGKEKITGIGAEPWHFRYVGYPHSIIMASGGMALEEYMEFLRNDTRQEHPYVFRDGENRIEISYLSLENEEPVVFELPESAGYWCSGTNEGGVVVSLFRGAA